METGNKRTNFLLCFLFFIASLLSKAMAVVLPLVLILIDLFRYGKLEWKRALNKIPFLLASLLIGMITLHIQSKDAMFNESVFGLQQRLVIASSNISRFVVDCFLPLKQSNFHPYPLLALDQPFPDYIYVFSFLGVVILAISVYFLLNQKKRSGYLNFGLWLYLITVVIVLQFFTVGNAIYAERYSYIPYIGLFVIIGHALYQFQEKYPKRKKLVLGIITGYLILFSVTTLQRNKVWANSGTLWTDVIEKFQDDNNCNLDDAYELRGNYFFTNENTFQDAIKDYTKMVTKTPMCVRNVGIIHYKWAEKLKEQKNSENARKYYSDAIQLLNESIRLNSRDPQSWYYRALTNLSLGDSTKAVIDLDSCIQINPKYLDAAAKKASIVGRVN